MRTSIYFLLSIFLIFGCKSGENKNKSDFTVNLSVKNAPQNTLVYLYFRGGDYTEKQDSAIVSANTNITLHGKSKQDIDFFYIEFSGKPYYIYLLADSGDNISLSVNLDTLQLYKVDNSKNSELIQTLENHLFFTNKKLSQALKENQDTSSIKQAQRDFSIDFINKHDTSLAAIIALSEKFADGTPVLPIGKYFDLYKKTAKTLGKRYATTEYYSKFIEFIRNYEINLARNKTPQDEQKPEKIVNFEATTFSGEKISLSDFKNKWILLNFGATWCNNCASSFDFLNKINGQKNLVVIQILLDSDKQKVEQIIQKHNINYYVIQDPKLWNSDIIKKYKINILPTNILISPQGKIELYSTDATMQDLEAKLKNIKQ